MNYQQTLDYLFAKLPLYQKVGKTALREGLSGVTKLCEHLGNPHHNSFKSIHIAGTNGKGSTSHMMASILQQEGYRVGLYTSPHLLDFRERIRLNGEFVSKKFVIDFVEKHKNFIDENNFSFFEVTVGLAFKYFAEKEVDVVVLEVGLGGRLDSTNIVTPILSIITNISFDHTNILGNTLAKIAFEKAGIIKKNVPVVVSTKQGETTQVFVNKALECNSNLYFAKDFFKLKNQNINFEIQKLRITNLVKNADVTYELDLTGSYQIKNLIGVLKACDVLNANNFKISDIAIKNGLKCVVSTTGLLGRWQIVNNNPKVICDTGHNEDGIKAVLKNIKIQTFETLHMVIGFVSDKDVNTILALLPKYAHYYFTQANVPRALNSLELANLALEYDLKGEAYSNVEDAYKIAYENANDSDLIFVGGSTFVVADFLQISNEI